MGISSTTLRLLIEAGLSGEALIAVVASIEDDFAESCHSRVDEQAERRREKDRERKRLRTSVENSAETSAEIPRNSTEENTLSPEAKSFPKPLQKTQPSLPILLEENPPMGGKRSPPPSRDFRGTRLSDAWQPTADDLAYARSIGINEPAARRQAEQFRDYWIARPGRDGVKLDWAATFRNWLRRFADDKGIAPSSEPNGEGRKLWEARMAMARKDRRWWTKWGPLPHKPGCRAPPDMLRAGDGDEWTISDETEAA